MESVLQQWTAFVQKEMESYRVMLAEDPLVELEKRRQPETVAIADFEFALKLMYGQEPTGMAEAYLARSLLIMDRAVELPQYTDRENRSGSPITHKAAATCVRQYILALLGRSWEGEALKSSAPAFVAWATRSFWDELSEASYLRGVRAFLIAGAMDNARELLRTKKRFKYYGAMCESFRGIVSAGGCPVQDQSIAANFDTMFEPWRIPLPQNKSFTEVNQSRFELGVIRDKFFVSKDCTIDWLRAIDGISA